jgi:hypothetical protein
MFFCIYAMPNALYRPDAGLCAMRVSIHSEGGMKNSIGGFKGYESAMKTIEKGVI